MGLGLQAQHKVHSIKIYLYNTRICMHRHTTFNSVLKHSQSLYNCYILPRTQQSSPWAYQCIIAVDWCIIALVNLPVGG